MHVPFVITLELFGHQSNKQHINHISFTRSTKCNARNRINIIFIKYFAGIVFKETKGTTGTFIPSKYYFPANQQFDAFRMIYFYFGSLYYKE